MFERFYNTPARKGHAALTRIHAGSGARHDILEWVRPEASVFVCDTHFKDSGIARAMARASQIHVSAEPGVSSIAAATHPIQRQPIAAVIALGGGSTIDTAKALHAWLSFGSWNQRDVTRPAGAPLLIAVPTTAGSGSETSRFFVLTDEEAGLKRSFRAWAFAPDVAVLDPELLGTAPIPRMLLGALDSFCHLWETLVCRGEASPWAAMLAEHWIPRQVQALSNLAAGKALSLENISVLQAASAAGGMAISNVRTGMMHTLAESLGPQTGLSHGEALAVFLQPVFEHYREAVASRAKGLEQALRAGPGSLRSLEALFEFWDEALRSSGLLLDIPNKLRARPIDWTAFEGTVARDTTLLKEHPVPTSPAHMVTLARNAVVRLCAKSPPA